MARYRYQPLDAGWIGISDMWHNTIVLIDCRQGGAQKAFEDLCNDMERAGWELGKRSFDNRYVIRGNVRWEIRIGVLGPDSEPPGPRFIATIPKTW